jgi:hypothetical protein
MKLNENYFALTAGVYSSIISLGLVDRAFDKHINYTMKSNEGTFAFLGPAQIFPGDGKSKIRIGVDPATFPQTYYLSFDKKELDVSFLEQQALGPAKVDSSYSEFPLLAVKVMQT